MNTPAHHSPNFLRLIGLTVSLLALAAATSCDDSRRPKTAAPPAEISPTTSAPSTPTTRAALPFTLGKDTTFIDHPLHPDGTPDYIAALNATHSQGVTPENNGFLLWLEVVGDDVLVDRMEKPLNTRLRDQALALCGARPTPPGTKVLQAYSDFLKPRDPSGQSTELGLPDTTAARHALWTAADHPQLAAFLAQQEKLFDRAVEVFERPHWWRPTVANPDAAMMTALFTNDSRTLREVSEDLSARATFRAKSGDFAGFLRDALAVKRLARHVAAGGDLMDLFLAAMFDEHANDALGAVAGSGTLTPAQCAALRKSLAELPPLPSLDLCLDGAERFRQLNTVILIATGRAATVPYMSEFAGIDIAEIDWNVALQHVNHSFEDLRVALREPSLAVIQKRARDLNDAAGQATAWMSEGLNLDPEPMKFTPREREEITNKAFAELRRRFHKQPGETRDAYRARILAPLLNLQLPAFEQPEELHRRNLMENQMLAALVAAAEIKAQTGVWPATLDALPPAALKDIPTDMYAPTTGARVHYAVTNGLARIYSVGRNGRDEGGKPHGQGGDDIVVGCPPHQP